VLCELLKDLVESSCGIMAVIEYGFGELSDVLFYGIELSGGVCYQRFDCMVTCSIGFGLKHTCGSVMTCRG